MKLNWKTILGIVVLVALAIWQGLLTIGVPLPNPFEFSAVALASPESFISDLAPVAVPIVQSYGLFPSVFLSQAALESGWGSSSLVQYHNLFGRKCGQEPCVEITTNEERGGVLVKEIHKFQVYDSLESAIQDYCEKFFRKYESGHPVFLIDTTSPANFVAGITSAPRPYSRYATDSRYEWKVLSIIRDYDLEAYDVK